MWGLNTTQDLEYIIGTGKGYWWRKWGHLTKAFSLVNTSVLSLPGLDHSTVFM